MHVSIFNFRRRRYLKWGLALVIIGTLVYALYDPIQPRSGGTWAGYGLGTVGAVLILWLMSFGIRKRAYRSNSGTLQGWLSAHVYLGTALLIIATLHTAFQFGYNVHTLAYVLMAIVIVSGMFGAWAYWKYPEVMTRNRANLTRMQMLEQVADLDRRMRMAARPLPSNFQNLVVDGANRTVIGGGMWAQLAARDNSRIVLPGSDGGHNVVPNESQDVALSWLAEQLSVATADDQHDQIRELIGLLNRKRSLLAKLRRDIQLHAVLEIWLYLHVPLSFGLLAALAAHVISVFLYW
jgi:hypothetical protein